VRILVVEDDPHIAAALQDALVRRGYDVTRARSGPEALALCADERFDLVLLDLRLPGIHGAEVAVRLRSTTTTPIVVVTCIDEEPSKVSLLRGGVDDYIVKPYSEPELLARIETVLRRTRRGVEPQDRALDFGDVRIDPAARTVTVAGSRVALTRKEFDVLLMLARAGGAVVDRQRILVHVWGTDWLGMSRTLEVHVATLRAKLGRPALIVTVRGIGYRIALREELPPPPPPPLP
jgi:DNA-binding response OmpR family regulator